jgi:hypothetical protein
MGKQKAEIGEKGKAEISESRRLKRRGISSDVEGAGTFGTAFPGAAPDGHHEAGCLSGMIRERLPS